jgi:L-rhamnonate dehydratase
MRIQSVTCHTAPMAGSWLTESVIANPMSIYPEYWERRASWFGAMTAAVISIATTDGVTGHGFVGGGRGDAVEPLLAAQFRPMLLGKSIEEPTLLQEQLYRASIFHGRGGLTQCVLSGIDIALWDALAKARGVPALRGAASRRSLPVYYTGNDPAAMREFGIGDMKIPVPFGPAHGEEGMARNVDTVARAREAIGPDAFLALDIYMSWNVDYTLRMYERIEKYNIAWLEEPVLPDDYRGYTEIRKRIGTWVTGGEHEYTLSGFDRLINEGCVDIVQPDIYRAGGPTALRKIADLARAAGVKLVCHGIGSPTYSFLATLDDEMTPFAEYVDIYRGTTKAWILTDDPRPVEGILTLRDAPGFGYDLNREAKAVATIW